MQRSFYGRFACFTLLAISRAVAGANVPKLLLISLDGFRYDYLDRANMSNFKRFYSEGVRARWLRSAFITKTLVNHYGAVTGLYPEYHGITGNQMLDGATGEWWNPRTCASNASCDRWFRGEPLWLTNHRQDPSQASRRRTGSLYWIGGDLRIQNYTAEQSLPLPSDENITFSDSLSKVLSWFSDPSAPINLGLVYHTEPDATGHRNGPESSEMNQTLQELDADFGTFLDKIATLPEVAKDLNIIVVSDHGMAVVNGSVNIASCLQNISEYRIVYNNPVFGLWPNRTVGTSEAYLLALAGSINDSLAKDPACSSVRVYTKTTIPYHYLSSLSSRIAPILLEAPPGYLFVGKGSASLPKGNHGWNNSWDKMRGIFVARGPAFRKSYLSDGFDNIHLYELMCRVLSMPPAPNNGSLDAVRHFLAESHGGAELKIAIALSVVVCILLIGIVAIVLYRRRLSITGGRATVSTVNAQLFIDDDEDAEDVHVETPLVG